MIEKLFSWRTYGSIFLVCFTQKDHICCVITPSSYGIAFFIKLTLRIVILFQALLSHDNQPTKWVFKGKQNKLFFSTIHSFLSSKDSSSCVPQGCYRRTGMWMYSYEQCKRKELFSQISLLAAIPFHKNADLSWKATQLQ